MSTTETRFTVETVERDGGTEIMVFDDDFGYDALLRINGDFSTDEQRREYAAAVAAALNAASIPTAQTTKFPLPDDVA